MKLDGLHIHRFGARAGLELTEVSPTLNVIHGPNGSGKTTIIQFLRWALFGHRDEVSGRYLNTGDTPASGHVSILDGQATQVLERTDDVSGLRNVLKHQGTSTPAQLPTTLSRNEFDRFFTINFDAPHDVHSLLRDAHQFGLPLKHDPRQLERLEQLRNQQDHYRSELQELRWSLDGETRLRERLAQIEQEIDFVERERHTRRQELDHQRQQALADVDEHRHQVQRLKRVVENIEAALDHRQQVLQDEFRQRVEARRATLRRRDQRVDALQTQIVRWEQILVEVRNRLQELQAHRGTAVEPLAAWDTADVDFYVRTLHGRIHDAEQDLTGSYDGDSWQDHEADAAYLRGLLSSTLQSMREDVARLSQRAQRQEQHAWQSAEREEWMHLTRTERELSELVTALDQQRQAVEQDHELWAGQFDSQLVDRYARETHHDGLPDLAPTLHDFRQRHLIERRDQALSREQAARWELEQAERVLAELDELLEGNEIRHQLERLQSEQAETQQALVRLQQRSEIEQRIKHCQDEIDRIEHDLSPSPLVDEAARTLQVLTDGNFVEIAVSDAWRCQVRDRVGRLLEPSQLSRGTQDQLHMSLSLAILAAYRRKGIEAPAIVNDVFGNLDQMATAALVGCLRDLAQRGQQILLFTRHDHIRDHFDRSSAKVFELVDQQATRKSPVALPFRTQPAAEMSPIIPDPTYRWVAEWQREPLTKPKSIAQPRPVASAQPAPAATSLTAASLLTSVPTLDTDLIRYLTKLHIGTVGELLDLAPEEAETSLGKHGITAEIIQRRQREILLMLHVGVAPLEAQLLVACGVPDPERLGRADEAVLHKRVESILTRNEAAERFGSLSRYDLGRIRTWIDAARRSNYRRRRLPRPQVERRTSVKQAPQPAEATATATVPMPSSPQQRFYLDVNDPVVDAPSIGPKTAEKLNAIDIYTVGNLLDEHADQIAQQLDDRRIHMEHVTQWQLQAQLVCRVPNLRGHDAQILVACGIEDPATLAALEPSSFLKRVKKYVGSKEGQRVLRNAKRPDLAEVTAWIEWADAARQLQAA